MKGCECVFKGIRRAHICAKCPPLVVIESPFKGNEKHTEEENRAYADECLIDSFRRGEAPFASHVFYTKVLNDHVPVQRTQGVEAGLAWGRRADFTVVYTDLGISPEMQLGIDRAKEQGRRVIYRQIRNNPPHFQDRD